MDRVTSSTGQSQLQTPESLTVSDTEREVSNSGQTQIVELIENQNNLLDKIGNIELERLDIEKETLNLRKQELEFLKGLKKTPIKTL